MNTQPQAPADPRLGALTAAQMAQILEATQDELARHDGDPCACGSEGTAKEHRLDALLDLVGATHGTTIETLAQWVGERASALEQLANGQRGGGSTYRRVLGSQVATIRALAEGVNTVAQSTPMRLTPERT